MKGADEGFFSSGVMGGEFSRVKTGMGDIAPTSPGDFDFREHLGGFFQNEDAAGFPQSLGRSNGGKKTGRTATDRHEIPLRAVLG